MDNEEPTKFKVKIELVVEASDESWAKHHAADELRALLVERPTWDDIKAMMTVEEYDG
jgi:hypothetical protein